MILAAGASRRLGECKALVDLGGATPLERLVRAGRCFDELPPLIVSGADREAIAGHLPAGCELAYNPTWESGRTGAVALAHELLPGRDLLIAPVDTPLVPAAVFAALLAFWLQAGAPANGWLAPRYTPAKGEQETPLAQNRDETGDGTGDGIEGGLVDEARSSPAFGHPVLIGKVLLDALAQLAPDEPLRCLRARARPLMALDVGQREVLDDLDEPADLEDLRRRKLDF